MRPRESMPRTMPVVFIFISPFQCVRKDGRMSVFYADTTQKMFPCRKNRKILSTSFLFSIQKVESFVNLNGRIRQKLLKEAKRGRFPAVPFRFSDSLSSGRRLAIDAQAVVRHWHLHPGGAVVHGHHHRGHCGQHHGNDEPLYKIRQFFHLLHPQLVFGRQRVRAWASSSAASGPESCFTHAGRSAAPGPVLSASAKLARPVSAPNI